MRGPDGRKTELNRCVSLLLLSILYMASLGLVCPTEVRAAGAASGSAVSAGGDAGAANAADVAGDIVASVTSTAGNDTRFSTTENSQNAVVTSVYGDSLGRAGPDSFVRPPPDTVWYSLTVSNAGNATDSFVFSTTSVKFRSNGFNASDSVFVTFWNGAGSAALASVTVPADSTGDFRAAIFVKSTAPRNDTIDVTIKATARGGSGGDTGGYIGFNNAPYAGDGDDTIGLPVGVINRKPIANAGPDTFVIPGGTVPLSGAASSDLDGDALTYQWTQESGPVRTLVPSATVASPSFGSDTAYTGIYVFRLTVTDPSGDSGVDTIGVSANNVPPVALAGPDTSVPNNATLTLNAGASSDANGDTIAFNWTKTAGPACAILNDTQAIAQVAMTAKGVYQFTVRVNDAVDTTYDTVQVTVLNTPPVSNAGSDTTRQNNDTLLLVGTASSDADAGDTLTYSWSKLSGPAATIVNATSATASVYMTLKGVYVFQLVVNDGTGTGVATVQDTVVNTKPVAVTSLDSTVTKRDTVYMTGAASADADTGDTLTYTWTQMSGPAVSLLPNGSVVNPSFASADTVTKYVFNMIVNDGTDTAQDTIEITAVNTLPVANAGPDSVIAAGAPVTLSGAASGDSNGDPLTHRWTQVGGPARNLSPGITSISPSFTSDTSFIGAYIFTLVVNDGFDTSAVDTVLVTAGNVPPVANAGPDTAMVVHPDTVTLNGSASSDLNGDTLSFIWNQISGPAVTLVPGGNVVNPKFYAAVTAQYVFQLRVFDGTDTSSPDTVLATAINTPPLANAGPDATGTAGNTVPLSGIASSDSNGDMLSFLWSQSAGPMVSFIPSPAVVTPAFVPTTSGFYRFVLRAADGNDTVYDTVDILIGSSVPANIGFAIDTHMLADTAGMVAIAVRVRDGFGNPVPGETVTFTITHPGSASIASIVTNSSGVCTALHMLGTASSFYRIRAQVDSTAVQQNFYAYGNRLNIPAQSDTPVGRGWKMWSANRQPSPDSLSAVIENDLGANAKVYEWQHGSAAVSALNGTRYYRPAAVKRGRAYWVKDQEGGILDVEGPLPTMSETVTVNLGAGWNQIGSGQYFFVDWGSSVRFQKSGETGWPMQTPGQAKDSGLIKNAVYWWDESISNYRWGPDSAGANLLPSVQMKPMAGFWFWAESSAIMHILPQPVIPFDSPEILNQAPKYLSAAYDQQKKSGNEQNWAIQLVAQSSGVTDLQNYVGVQPTAEAARQSSLFEPPGVASGYLTLGIRDPDNSGSPLSAAAYTAPITTAKSWKVEIYTDLTTPVALTWDNLSNVPENYEVYLVTPNGAVDMRKHSSSILNPQSSVLSMTLAIGLPEYVAGLLAAPLSKDQTFVYPNPGPDGTGIMNFKHNVIAGDVKIKIFDVGGRLVKELTGTVSPIPWDTTNRFGQKVGSGVYIYMMESGGVRLVDKLAVVR